MVAGPRSRDLALTMVLVMALRHYGWPLFPVGLSGLASKAFGGIAILFLLGVVVFLTRSLFVALAASWWAVEEIQVSACSFLFMAHPWPLQPGAPLCSSLFGIDFGAIGIVVIGWLVWFIYRSRHG